MTTRRWLAAALGSMALLTAALLPAAPAVRWAPTHVTERQALEVALQELDLRLRVRGWVDSLAPRVLSGNVGAPLVEGPPGEHPAYLEKLRVAVAPVVGSGPAPTPFGRFAVITDEEDDPLHRSAATLRPVVSGAPVAVAGTDGAESYCLAVSTFTRSDFERHVAQTVSVDPTSYHERERAVLGACSVVARYGLPGPVITTWLNQTGRELATASRRVSSVESWENLVQLRKESSAGPLLQLLQMEPRRFLSGDAQRCLAGEEAPCARLVTEVRSGGPTWTEGGGVQIVLPGWRTAFPALPEVVDPAFLSRLEQHFGPERFGRFWTSDLDVEPAFEAAFGLPLGRYVMERAHEVYGVVRPGPGVDAGGWWGLGVALALGLGAGAWVGARRRPA